MTSTVYLNDEDAVNSQEVMTGLSVLSPYACVGSLNRRTRSAFL